MRWDTAPFGLVCRIEQGQVDPRDQRYADLPLIGPEHIISGTGALRHVTTAQEQGAISGKYLCDAGGIVYSKIRPRLRKVAIAPTRCLVSADAYPLLPGPRLDHRFLRYYLLSERFSHAAIAESERVAMPKLNRETLNAMPVPVPPPVEQRRIADYLDAKTARIDTVLTKNSEAATLVEARFWATVEERVWPRSAPRTRLGTLAESMIDGPFGSSLASKHYVDEGPRVVRLGNIGRARFLDHDVACIEHSHYSELLGHRVLAGDLVVAGLGDSASNAPAGRAAVIPGWLGDAIVKADCHRVRLPRKAIARFFAWQLSSPRSIAEASSLARGSTRPRLNLTLNGERTVAVPSLSGQQEIASALDRLWDETRELSERMSRQRELLTERRRALITAAVTGEIEV